MNHERAPLQEVTEAIRRANYNHTGESPEELLGSLGWTVQEYKIALVEAGGKSSNDRAKFPEE